MRYWQHFLLIIVIPLIVFPVPVGILQAAQVETCPTLIARQDNNYSVSFIQPATGETVHTDQLPYHFMFSYSPDCRFLIGQSTSYKRCNPGLIIWDATTGERRQTFQRFCDRVLFGYPHIIWRPDNTVAIISEWRTTANSQRSDGHRYLWYPDSNQLIELQINHPEGEINLFQTFWDDARGWLWSSGEGGVVAFNIATGEQVGNYINLPESTLYYGTRSYFTFSPDFSKVIVHGQHDFLNWIVPALSVYDIASGVGVALNPELNAAGEVALSPDNRYLIMNYSAIRVWDLQNLPENLEDRLPIYRLNRQGRDSNIYFVNEHILAVENGDTLIQWDLHTGQQIEAGS